MSELLLFNVDFLSPSDSPAKKMQVLIFADFVENKIQLMTKSILSVCYCKYLASECKS